MRFMQIKLISGSIAGFLSLAGKDVTCIARGAHL
ncbi:2-dehydropantoate 2-reductase, partial [Bacteroides fragilis]